MRCVAEDSTIKFVDAGVLDGTPTGTTVAVTALCKRVMYEDNLNGTIDTSGFETDVRLRGKKGRYRIELELVVDLTLGPVTAVKGHYGKYSHILGGAITEEIPTAGLITSNVKEVVSEQETIQRITLEGPADLA